MITLDRQAFDAVHQAFLDHMQDNPAGVPFRSFDHPWLAKVELNYKQHALLEGRKALALDRWGDHEPGQGKILAAVRNACVEDIAANLLTYRYGDATGNSAAPLYRVEAKDEIREIEEELLSLAGVTTTAGIPFGDRFDRFADFLRKSKLGCKWDFMSYLAFLLEPAQCFPVHSGRLEALIRFYGINEAIQARVHWATYQVLFDVADALRENLIEYGATSPLQIQSYMFIVATLLLDGSVDKAHQAIASTRDEMTRRIRLAEERERVGLAGEQHVLEVERAKLRDAGRDDLAKRVTHVACDDSASGYDIRSFDPSGNERHIEVKTTRLTQQNDPGFFITANEYSVAEDDPAWCLIRVWEIDSTPSHEDLGNIVRDKKNGWHFEAASWKAVPARDET